MTVKFVFNLITIYKQTKNIVKFALESVKKCLLMVQFHFHENSTRNQPDDRHVFICNIIVKFENLSHFRHHTLLKLQEINGEQGRVHVIRKVDTLFFLRNCVNKGILGNKY